MTQTNVDIVERVYEAASRRDAAVIFALYDPEVVWDMSRHPYGEISQGRIYHGDEGLRRRFGEWYDAFEDFEHDREELTAVGEHVISVGTDRARGRASGATVEWRHIAGVWTVRDGRVARVAWFGSRADAVAAAGSQD